MLPKSIWEGRIYGEPLAYSPRPGTEWPLHEYRVNKWDSSQHVTLNTTKTSFGVPTACKSHHAVTSWAQSVTVIKPTCVQSKRVAAGIGNCLELCLLRLLPFLDKAVIPSMGLSWWYSGQKSICQCRGHGFKPWSRKIPHATHTTKPIQPNYWSLLTQEPVLCNKRSYHNEKPVHHNEE